MDKNDDMADLLSEGFQDVLKEYIIEISSALNGLETQQRDLTTKLRLRVNDIVSSAALASETNLHDEAQRILDIKRQLLKTKDTSLNTLDTLLKLQATLKEKTTQIQIQIESKKNTLNKFNA